LKNLLVNQHQLWLNVGNPDTASRGVHMRLHLLDMGKTKYGDCLLVTKGNRRILIDGAHPGDKASLLAQLKLLTGQNAPFDIDLLIVTHCHSDHIGCLPALVSTGDLKIKSALVADEKFGWGRSVDGDSPVDARGLSAPQRYIVSALQEEDHSDLNEAELEQFLQDAGTLEDKYIEMLDSLGDKVVRYGRDATAKVQQIEQAFSEFGLKVLGPTRNHLVKCAEAIAQGSDAFADAISGANSSDESGVEAYRRMARSFAPDAGFAADQPGVGAAKNDQSIVLKLDSDGWSALLGGDMQFAKAEVSGLSSMMTTLRQKCVDAGPYDFIKLSHHTSYNGVDASFLDEHPSTALYGHTGGSKDASHPDEGALELLESRSANLSFARTDRNGIITIEKTDGSVRMTVSRGELNDFSPNTIEDVPEPSNPVAEGSRETVVESSVAEADHGMVEVITRVPHTTTKVTITIQVEPGDRKKKLDKDRSSDRQRRPTEPVRPKPKLVVAGGRVLPKLLYVTCGTKLASNIGQMESEEVLRALALAPGARVLDLPVNASEPEKVAELVRRAVVAGGVSGVVVVGGYDVVPSNRLDVLDAALRRRLVDTGHAGDDADDFLVWSDDHYGDDDGDGMPELPVTRIPDGRRADVLFAALQAAPQTTRPRFGVRNFMRSFAEGVFPSVPGQRGELLVSETLSPEDVPTGAALGFVYFMLHGSARDGTRFWGETASGDSCDAFSIENIPASAPGSIVLSGCCWGALTTSPPAARARPGVPLRPRGPEASLAVAYLKAGALAFVGCTGSHYSPLARPFDYFGKPMHDAFWTSLAKGRPPALALFEAKTEFAKRLPHGRTDPFSQAVELKILRQFTCLGLGW
jgi:beta-lactamase superfamily II metal-dependent hydrolase